jgi:hypothetical protein
VPVNTADGNLKTQAPGRELQLSAEAWSEGFVPYQVPARRVAWLGEVGTRTTIGEEIIGKEEIVEQDGPPQAQAGVYRAYDRRREHRPRPELF